MKKNTVGCSHNELKLIGDFWTLAIVQAMEQEQKRFCQLEREVTGISPATLANRLKKLEQEKLVTREEETLDKLSVAYKLTTKGQGLLPILREIQHFAQKHL